MNFDWNAVRNTHKKRLANTLKVLNSKTADKNSKHAANRLAVMVDSDHRRVEVAFNKIVTRSSKRAFLARFKTPVHTLSGKYTATVMALLEYVDANNINLDRWILAQDELIKQPYFNMYMCYGDAALERYTSWENKQSKKYLRGDDREKQTDSNLQAIRESVIAGHIAALSWIPQLKDIKAPDVATALFYLLPNIQGWYALSHETFRELVMESGLCDQKHMIMWWKKFQRSQLIRDTCRVALHDAIVKYGSLKWEGME